MNKLKEIIETVIAREIEQDEGVFDNGYILAPVYHDVALKGDGKPEEIITDYQLDFFFRKKGETIAKAKALIEALSDYPMDDFAFTWESTARLWRCTTRIETI